MATTKRRTSTSRVAIALAVLAAAATATAGDVAARQASEQVRRGYEAARNGYWQEALFRFERANALTPKEPRILNNIAVSLEAAGRFEEALAAYDTALSIAPNDRVLRRNYSLFREFYEAHVKSPPVPAGEGAAGEAPGPESVDGKGKDDA